MTNKPGELKKFNRFADFVSNDEEIVVITQERDTLKARVDELMKSNKEMSDLIYSEDGYIASQDSLIKKLATLKRQLKIAVNALQTSHDFMFDSGYHEFQMYKEVVFALKQIKELQDEK